MIDMLKRVYEHSVKTRLSKTFGMELHEEEFDVLSSEVSFYYADFSKCILNKPHALDDDGIFYLKLKGYGKIVYNICAVAEFAIIEFEKHLRTKSEESKLNFRRQVDWLVDNATIEGDRLYWYYQFDFGEHKAPWGSGISQGMGISVLVRAAVFLKDEKYRELAEMAARAMLADVEDGGYRYGKGKYADWIEESHLIPHILNGHIFSLLGLFDLYRITKNDRYYEHFLAGANSIKANISDFDLGIFTRYDTAADLPASNSYHYIHCVLFEILFNLTEDRFFLEYATKWAKIYESDIRKARFTANISWILLRKRILGN